MALHKLLTTMEKEEKEIKEQKSIVLSPYDSSKKLQFLYKVARKCDPSYDKDSFKYISGLFGELPHQFETFGELSSFLNEASIQYKNNSQIVNVLKIIQNAYAKYIEWKLNEDFDKHVRLEDIQADLSTKDLVPESQKEFDWIEEHSAIGYIHITSSMFEIARIINEKISQDKQQIKARNELILGVAKMALTILNGAIALEVIKTIIDNGLTATNTTMQDLILIGVVVEGMKEIGAEALTKASEKIGSKIASKSGQELQDKTMRFCSRLIYLNSTELVQKQIATRKKTRNTLSDENLKTEIIKVKELLKNKLDHYNPTTLYSQIANKIALEFKNKNEEKVKPILDSLTRMDLEASQITYNCDKLLQLEKFMRRHYVGRLACRDYYSKENIEHIKNENIRKNEFQLRLISKEVKSEKGNIYLKIVNNKLTYSVITSTGVEVKDIEIKECKIPNPLNPESLIPIKQEILDIVKNNGHIPKHSKINEDTILEGLKVPVPAVGGGNVHIGGKHLREYLYREIPDYRDPVYGFGENGTIINKDRIRDTLRIEHAISCLLPYPTLMSGDQIGKAILKLFDFNTHFIPCGSFSSPYPTPLYILTHMSDYQNLLKRDDVKIYLKQHLTSDVIIKGVTHPYKNIPPNKAKLTQSKNSIMEILKILDVNPIKSELISNQIDTYINIQCDMKTIQQERNTHGNLLCDHLKIKNKLQFNERTKIVFDTNKVYLDKIFRHADTINKMPNGNKDLRYVIIKELIISYLHPELYNNFHMQELDYILHELLRNHDFRDIDPSEEFRINNLIRRARLQQHKNLETNGDKIFDAAQKYYLATNKMRSLGELRLNLELFISAELEQKAVMPTVDHKCSRMPSLAHVELNGMASKNHFKPKKLTFTVSGEKQEVKKIEQKSEPLKPTYNPVRFHFAKPELKRQMQPGFLDRTHSPKI